MAQTTVRNRIAAPQQAPKESVTVTEYKCGDETIRLSPNTVRRYLVNGSGEVTDQEVAMFIGLCKYQHLNPFLREAYLIKYGNQPATIVTGKEAITKRAMRNATFLGQQAGVVIYHEEAGELEYRTGSLVIPGEKLVGGWAKVFVKGYNEPIEAAVSIEEYIGRKNDGSINSNWSKRPATMIRKVALMQALREAFPEDLGGMYASEEIGAEESAIIAPVTPQEPQEAVVEQRPAETPVQPQNGAGKPAQAPTDDLQGVF